MVYKRRLNQQGFTVAEVLMVLLVTGLILASSLLIIRGAINKTEFTTAINEINSEIQQTINNVSTGFYLINNHVNCFNNGTDTVAQLKFSPTNTTGTNVQCQFEGVALQFKPVASPPTLCNLLTDAPNYGFGPTGYGPGLASIPDPEQYFLYPLVGLTNINTSHPSQSLDDSGATPLSPDCDDAPPPNNAPVPPCDASGNPPGCAPEGKTVGTLQDGLTTVSMCVEPNAGAVCGNGSTTGYSNPAGTIAFVISQSRDLSSNGALSQASHVDLYPIRCTELGDSEQRSVGQIDNLQSPDIAQTDQSSYAHQTGTGSWECPNFRALTQYLNPSGGVQICFKSATTNESGLITIGQFNGNLGTTLKRYSTTNCT